MFISYHRRDKIESKQFLGTDTPYLLDGYGVLSHAGLMRDKPWVLLGDFNAALNLEDHSYGGYEPSISMREFKECVHNMQVMDVNCTGLHFTWTQKPKGSNGVLKKIDRIMGNLQFQDDFPGSLYRQSSISISSKP
ncbi:RNA-directed DNA polymerase, eukaryota, reverse transcriptase zinc-binding domain protein [Tanacetum coccineum]